MKNIYKIVINTHSFQIRYGKSVEEKYMNSICNEKFFFAETTTIVVHVRSLQHELPI